VLPPLPRGANMSGSGPLTAPRNQLLAALPQDVLASLMPKLQHISLGLREHLIVPDKTIEAVYLSKVVGSPWWQRWRMVRRLKLDLSAMKA
jgi:hypothetical protein